MLPGGRGGGRSASPSRREPSVRRGVLHTVAGDDHGQPDSPVDSRRPRMPPIGGIRGEASAGLEPPGHLPRQQEAVAIAQIDTAHADSLAPAYEAAAPDRLAEGQVAALAEDGVAGADEGRATAAVEVQAEAPVELTGCRLWGRLPRLVADVAAHANAPRHRASDVPGWRLEGGDGERRAGGLRRSRHEYGQR